MTLAVEWYVPADEAGFASVDVDDSSSPYTSTIGGYLPFRIWLTTLELQVNVGAADYSFSYDVALDRVVISKNSGPDCGFTWASDSMARLLGWSDAADTATPASTHTAPNPPGGLVQILGWTILEASPGKRVERQDYGFGRARNTAFGTGIDYGLRIMALPEPMRRFAEGPCSTGRAIVGPLSGSGNLAYDNSSGVIDGHWSRVARPETIGPVGVASNCTCSIRAATSVDSVMRSGASASWQLLSRGYHVALWARIEGLPYTFAEKTLGVGSVAQPESATLAVSEKMQALWRVDRDRGTTGGGQVRIGVFDPDDDLEIFGGTSTVTRLTSDLAFDGTTAVVDDASGFASSGIAHVGHEAIDYGGKTGTSLTSLSRGAYGPSYAFRSDAPLGWATVSDRPLQWGGRLVYLWAAFVDPYGRRADGYDVQVYAGELAAPPVYDSGVWWMDCEDILTRLSRPVGQQSEATISPGSRYSGLGLANGPVVGVEAAGVLQYRISEPGASFDVSGQVEITTLISAITETVTSSDYLFVPWATLMNAAISYVRGIWLSEGGPTSTILYPVFVQMEQDESGAWIVEIRASQTGVFPGDGIYQLGPIVLSTGATWAGWGQSITISKDTLEKYQPPTGLYQYHGLYKPGLDGRTIDSVVASVTSEFGVSGDTWPSSGVIVIDGQDGSEIAEFGDAFVEDGRVYMSEVKRGVSGTSKANVHAEGVPIAIYIELSGSAGQQLASLLESSGYGDRGDYDTLPFGYALPTDIVAEDQLAQTQGGVMVTTTAVAPGQSAVDHLGGLMASQGYAICPVRGASNELLIGVCSITPFGLAHGTLTDADIRTDAGPILREIQPAPNVVEIQPSPLGGIERAMTRVVIAEARIAEGERSVTYQLPATASSLAASLLRAWAQQSMASRRGCVVYEFQVGPDRDWLPGQRLTISLTHQGLRKSDGSFGLSGSGVILECSRSLDGRVRISLLVREDNLSVGPLCPRGRAVSISGSNLRLDTSTVDGITPLLEASETVRVYEAGSAANTADLTVTSVSGVTIGLSSVPAWLTTTAINRGAVYATYPDAGSCSSRQAQFVHSEDGSQWL